MESAERAMLSMRIPEEYEGIIDPLAARLGELSGVDDVFYVPDDREIKLVYKQNTEADSAAVEEVIRQVVDAV